MNGTTQTDERPSRPHALSAVAENISAELKQLNQWVVWRYVHKNGRWTKPLFRVDGKGYASSTDPESWGEFAAAHAVYRGGSVDGDALGYRVAHCHEDKSPFHRTGYFLVRDREWQKIDTEWLAAERERLASKKSAGGYR